MRILTGISVLFLLIRDGNCQAFSYDGIFGPENWGQKYTTCVGKYQSPINIELSDVISKSFPKMVFENFHKPFGKCLLQNSGHTVILSRLAGITPSINGGPLKSKYNFQQLHFHWGRNDTEGSENTINNHSFPLELHMVFYNSKYGTYEASLNHSDGLTVMSFLYHTAILDNPNYIEFEDNLSMVENVGAGHELENAVSLDDFTSKDRSKYFTYNGSLTTPPCSEIVTWMEFVTTIPLSHSQIARFRSLSAGTQKLDHNFRPTQPLHDRKIYFNSSTKIGEPLTLILAIIIVPYIFI